MTDHARRALLGALALSPVAGAAVALASASAEPIATADADAPGLAYWQRLDRLSRRAEARSLRADELSDAAERAVDATPEGSTERVASQAAYDRARQTASTVRALAEGAARTPARDWPSLSIKLAILRHSAGQDELAHDDAWDVLEADIRHCMTTRA